jgi:hypothetical protein
MNKGKLIMKAQLCPYCEGKPKLTSSKVVYGKDYGPIWLCSCGAFVGCHPGTEKPLGMVANQELRQLRKEAHHCFDLVWKTAVRVFGVSKHNARNHAYERLSLLTGTPRKYMHIAMLDEDECRNIINICKNKSDLL